MTSYVGMGDASANRGVAPEVTAAVLGLLPGLMRQARAMVGSGPAAEDLVFDTIAALLPVWAQISTSPASYARRAMVNRHLDQVRKVRVANAHRSTFARPEAHTIDEAIVVRLDLDKALAQLPERTRVVLILRYLEHLPAKEVALILKIPAGTVRRITHEGLVALRLTSVLTRNAS